MEYVLEIEERCEKKAAELCRECEFRYECFMGMWRGAPEVRIGKDLAHRRNTECPS